AQLPDHGLLHRRERRVDVHERHVRERGHDDRSRVHGHRTDAEADEQRPDEERDGAETPAPRHAAGADARDPHRVGDHEVRFATAATARGKPTIRGPQRDAMLSFTATTRWFFTAETFPQPGRSETVAAVWPQQTESERTTMSGFAERMYSADSFG